MAYNTNHAETTWLLPGGQLVDVSTSSTSYAPVPFQGVLVDAFCTISAAVTGDDSVVTVKKLSGGVESTLGTITVAYSGSAPGSTFQIVMTGTEAARTFKLGDTIEFASGGQSSTTSITNFLAVFKGM